jgi:hypothetical protein
MIECGNMSATKLKNEIGVLLLDEPMSLKEVAATMGIKEKKAYNLLKSMFTDERVISFKDADGERRYRVTEEEADKAQKRKARSEKK